jgi:2,5-diamino-6-(ribosylamino)-4(3H)-pyrimidinone 5'-phosphate reductase
LSTHLKDRVERIEQVIAKLREESAKGKPLVVEGKKDLQALCDLGFIGPILTVKTGGKSFLEVTAEIEALDAGEVILLLDFDRRGKEGTERLQQSLERTKIKVNSQFWRELHGLVGREIHCIESLPSYLNTLQQKIA